MGENKPDDENTSIEVLDGRLSAIMPRKLFLDDAAVKSGLLQVFVRMKPLPESTETCMFLEQSHLLKASWRNTEAVYKFSKVFQQDADQAAVYEGTTATLVEDFLDFRQPSAVVMAYGVTSAGKTFTMQGTPDKPGLVPLALKDVFQTISGGSHGPHRVSLSVCEIYNECIHDLLAPPSLRSKPALRFKEDKRGHIQVQGMNEVHVHSSKEALELLKRAGKARQSAGTGVNERSSRSHAIITVKLETAVGAQVPSAAAGDDSTMPAVRQAFLHFVDLAGCERVKRTGNSGARLRESVAINSSLMTLARCLEVLRYNQQHPGDEKVIPYRESKITHLFKSVLHGNGRFVMLVNVSPACEAFNETKRVLQYAALATKVTMTSEVEHDMTGQPWPAAAGRSLLPADDDAAAAASTAATDAAAASAAAMLSAAQARIEELLDDKADLEYEIDVVERKVELLREELIRCEVEKEQVESEVRAEVQEEMEALLQEATAQAQARAAKSKEETATAKQEAAQAQADAAEARQAADQANIEADIWKQKAMELELQLQRQEADQQQQNIAQKKEIKELKAALEQAKRSTVPLAEHKSLLQEAAEVASVAALEVQAKHIAQMAITENQHNMQLQQAQQQLAAMQAELAALKEHQISAKSQAQQQEALVEQHAAQLKTLVADALQVLGEGVGHQHQCADATQLEAMTQQLQAAASALAQQQQQGLVAAAVQRQAAAAKQRVPQLQNWSAQTLQLLEQIIQQQSSCGTEPGLAGFQALTQQLQSLDGMWWPEQPPAAPAAAAELAVSASVRKDEDQLSTGRDDSKDPEQPQQQKKRLAAASEQQVERVLHQKQQHRTTLAGTAAPGGAAGCREDGGRCNRRAIVARVLPDAPEQLQFQQGCKVAAVHQASGQGNTCAAAQEPSIAAVAARRSRRNTLAATVPVKYAREQQQQQHHVMEEATAAVPATTAAADALQHAVVQKDMCTTPAEAAPVVSSETAAQQLETAAARRGRRATMASSMPVVLKGQEQQQTAAAVVALVTAQGGILATEVAAGKRRRRTLAGGAQATEHQESMQAQVQATAAVGKQRGGCRRRTLVRVPATQEVAAAAVSAAGSAAVDAPAAGLLGVLESITEVDGSEQERDALETEVDVHQAATTTAADNYGLADTGCADAAAVAGIVVPEAVLAQGSHSGCGTIQGVELPAVAVAAAAKQATSRKRQRGKHKPNLDYAAAEGEHSLQQQQHQYEAATSSVEAALRCKKQRRVAGNARSKADQQQHASVAKTESPHGTDASKAEEQVQQIAISTAVGAAEPVEKSAATAASKASLGKARSGARTKKASAKQKRQMSAKQEEHPHSQEEAVKRVQEGAVAQAAAAGAAGHQELPPDDAAMALAAAAGATAGAAAATAFMAPISAAAADRTGHNPDKPRNRVWGQLGQIQEDAEEGWRPAERVLADVAQIQLGVAEGRRATVATMQGNTSAVTGADKQGLLHFKGSITPVAFRTRRRHG